MIGDLGLQDPPVDQHGTALVPFLKDRASPPVREIDEPDRDGNGDEDRDEEGSDQASHRGRPGGDDIGDIGDRGHHRAHDFAARQRDVGLRSTQFHRAE